MLFVALLSFCADAFMLESSYEKAHIKALNTGKSLVVFLTKKNCQECNSELAKLMNDKDMSSAINKHAVFVIVQQGQKESYPIEMLYTIDYPALFILDKHELLQCNPFFAQFNVKEIVQCIASP